VCVLVQPELRSDGILREQREVHAFWHRGRAQGKAHAGPNRVGQRVSSIGQGAASQISRAYSLMVRSLEKLPEAAMFKTALRDHASLFAYSSATRRCASE